MAIPVYLQQFKAAGIYRVVFDKSTMLNQNSEILRLVVGYSEQGPFNIPTYVSNVATFKTLYGDISKKLEKRGVWFHRMAQQALATGPILALNLKKFKDETVDAVTIDTDFTPKFDAISLEKVYVEDIYDTSRFWELSAEKLNDMRTVDGSSLDKYINICTTDTEKSSATFFIRKAVGTIVSNYKVTLNDWYADGAEQIPEYLENAKSTLVSDYMAEIFVFKGKFTKEQVLASTSLKKHFTTDDNGELVLRKFELDAFGEPVDSLESLFNDETSGAIGRYVGSLIPYMKNKKGQYISLDIVFNEDQHLHSMMMSFNTDMLEDENPVNINISGKAHITDALLRDICQGDATVSMLGNKNVEVVANTLNYTNNITSALASSLPFQKSDKRITGVMVITGKNEVESDGINDSNYSVTLGRLTSDGTISKVPVKDENGLIVKNEDGSVQKTPETVTIKVNNKFEYDELLERLDGVYEITDGSDGVEVANPADWNGKKAIISIKNIQAVDGVYTTSNIKIGTEDFKTVIVSDMTFGHNDHTHIYNSSLTFAALTDNWELYHDDNTSYMYTATKDNSLTSVFNVGDAMLAYATTENGFHKQAFITAIDTVSADENLYYKNSNGAIIDALAYEKLVGTEKEKFKPTDYSVIKFTERPVIHGKDLDADNLVVDSKVWVNRAWNITVYVQTTNEDGSVEYNVDRTETITEAEYNTLPQHMPDNIKDGVDIKCRDNCVKVANYGHTIYKKAEYEALADKTFYVEEDVDPSHNAGDIYSWLVRLDSDVCQENGALYPVYLQGYTYGHLKPESTDMLSKLEWQNTWMLAALTDYKGLRTGLLNKSDIDYRYIIDTFETYVENSAKKVLSFLAKEKQSAFAILNFPAVKSFVKCPYASYLNDKGVFDVQYVVDGYNKKKAHWGGFSLPTDDEGASFCAFYTPLKFSDGYVDSIVPSAALVSNLFMQKYLSRKPYYIVAGPTHGAISAAGLVGPDYNYSKEELNIIEPYGVNCMVYRPNFGTFINANQTAKQIPLSALSRVNVRELVIYLQDEVEKVLQAYQWEFNNATTRNAILNKANSICANIQANGGIQAFQNIMDESNNTPEIIDNEMAILSTHIEPGFGCGKMVHELTIYKTGGLSSAVIG